MSCLRPVCSVFYFFVAAQGAYYVVLRFERTLRGMDGRAFRELRQLTDAAIAAPLKVLYLSTVVLMALWLCLAYASRAGAGYWLFAAALGLLVADLVLAMRVSVPLNQALFSATGDPAVLQAAWIRWMSVRGWLSVLGMILLLFA